jgi:glycerol kinase
VVAPRRRASRDGGGVSELLLGLDVGTSSVKAVLFDGALVPVAEARRPIASHHAPGGRVEQDAEAILRDVVAVVAELLDGCSAADVEAVGLDHQGESVVAWDARDGRPLSPVLSWQDQRGQALLAEVDPAVLARSGLPADPYFSASKLAWLVREDAGVREAARAGRLRLGTLDAFLLDRLAAGSSTDLSTASRTQLLALGGSGWDPALLDAFGLDEAWLPVLGPTWGALGALEHPDWPAPLPLCARAVDQQAALAGAGCARPGDVKATYGTGVFVLAHAGAEPPAPRPGVLATVAWSDGVRTEYALEGGVFAAGALLDWLAGDLGLAPDVPALCAAAAAAGSGSGVCVLPALNGLGAPWWRPEARGVIAGLHGGVRPGHVAHAALDALAHRVADIVEAFGASPAQDTPLRVDGGLTRDALLLARQADAIGRPVLAMGTDTTARGSALLAGVGAGRFASVAAASELLTPGAPVLPRTTPTQRAAERAAWGAWVRAALALPHG